MSSAGYLDGSGVTVTDDRSVAPDGYYINGRLVSGERDLQQTVKRLRAENAQLKAERDAWERLALAGEALEPKL